MDEHCAVCGRTIEVGDDEHYQCSEHDYVVCDACHYHHDCCPTCEARLVFVESSITKALFEGPEFGSFD